MLWNQTHRDVHPDPTRYDEVRDRTYAYAVAIKSADPSALTAGSTVWGCTAYGVSHLPAVGRKTRQHWTTPPHPTHRKMRRGRRVRWSRCWAAFISEK